MWQTTRDGLFNILGSPEIEELARLDGKPLKTGLPTQLVKTASWVDWTDDYEDIRLIDLGEAFLKGAEPAKLAQPDALRAPETILTDEFDYKLDLWRASIVVNRFSSTS